MALGRQGLLGARLFHQLGVFLGSRGFELIGRHQAAHAGRIPDIDLAEHGGDGGRAGSQQEAAARHPRG